MFRKKTRRHSLEFSAILILPMLLYTFLGCVHGDEQTAMSWPAVTNQCRPWTYWWWMGSAVDKPNLTRHLEAYSKAGMGGVHIVPIYGVKGAEDKFIDYLSPSWMDMLAHTVSEAQRIGMGVDMTTGTGWPFGGPQVKAEDAPLRVALKNYRLEAGRLRERLHKNILQKLIAYSDNGEIVDVTEKVAQNGVLNWLAPPGEWQVYAISQLETRQTVKRAAPGGEGNVIDPFSYTALKNYLKRFDEAFADYQAPMVRAFYNDSYEYGSNWTDDFLEQFESRRGYDLLKELPAFFEKESKEKVARVKSDYRETLSDLLLEMYITPWVQWSHAKGIVTRNQAHGSPGNLLDLYAAADIPETEFFGTSNFNIPGLPIEPNEFLAPYWVGKPDVLMAKFASSAAHVTGKKLVSSESCTWLGEHFRVALSQVKPEIDKLFVSGINHVFYHGMAYSPVDEVWPGWLFYASTNFAPSNSFWRDIPGLNNYIGRCQSILQDSLPNNDLLLYFPVYDLWHKEGLEYYYTVHHEASGWLYDSKFHKVAKKLWDRGYTFDYISDRQLAASTATGGKVRTQDVNYRAVVIPQCRLMPLRTLEKLISLARAGSTIIIKDSLPADVPGLGNLTHRRSLAKQLLSSLDLSPTDQSGIKKTTVGKGQILVGKNLEQMLELVGICREEVVDTGIEFIRRRHSQGLHYFLTNLGKDHVNGWVRLHVAAKSIVILDPLSSRTGLAALREQQEDQTEVYLQLRPGQSCILRTFSSRQIKGPKWQYLQTIDRAHEIKGTWSVTFIEGGPKLPAGFQTNSLTSWTKLDDHEAKRFAGTARYTTTFDKPALGADEWMLDLGKVCHSARVRVNGHDAGILWSVPFQIPIGKFLRKGENKLEVEVTNLSANRIADLDRRKVQWKKFYNINFVNVGYGGFDASKWPLMDSGLLGPVRLIPAEFKSF